MKSIITKPYAVRKYSSCNWGTAGDSVWHTLAQTSSTGGTDSPTGYQIVLDYTAPLSGGYKIEAVIPETICRQSSSGALDACTNVSLYEVNYLSWIGSISNFHAGYGGSTTSDNRFFSMMHNLKDIVQLQAGLTYKFKVMKYNNRNDYNYHQSIWTVGSGPSVQNIITLEYIGR